MDYDLNRLGSLEFEHMIQALAVAELRVPVTTFGVGADGGREATFEASGEIMLHEPGTTWSGYGVVQAKSIRFAGDPAKNAASMTAAVEAELNKFVSQNGKKPVRDPAPVN